MRHAVESNRANFFRPAFTRPLRLAPPPCLVLEIPHRSQRCTFLAQGRIYAVPSVAFPPGHLQFCFSPPTFGSVSGLTIIVLPDTQNEAQFFPSVLDSQTSWIVNNQKALNIQMVLGVGDIVNDGAD